MVRLYLLQAILIALILSVSVNAQSSPGTFDEFPVGTGTCFIGGPQDVRDTTLYSIIRYNQIRDLGINFINQRAVVPVGGGTIQPSNLERIAEFKYSLAINDSGTGTSDTSYDAELPENVDWINYFTQAKYRKWEAEEDPIFDDNVKIRHQRGSSYTINDTSGWKTDANSVSGDSLIYGPRYWQYPRYTFSNPEWNPKPIDYYAVFRLKISSIPHTTQPVCSLIVMTRYLDTTSHQYIDSTLEKTLLTTDNFPDTGYHDFSLSYSYEDFIDIAENPITFNTHLPGGIEDKPGYFKNSQVQFKVIWLGNRNLYDLYVDYIEVYDRMIWNFYFNSSNGYQRMLDSIINYDNMFTQNPQFYSRLKYYLTQDEPHSIDCYEPLRKVQEIIDLLNVGPDLIIHWYPGWDAKRDGDITWDQYDTLVQPKKLHFWYAPFTCDEITNERDNRDFTLTNLRYNLQYANSKQPGFILAAQTFGYWTQGHWDRWMTPTPAEVKAETMLALAHGCKGLIYEGYYSSCGVNSETQGLVKCPDSSYAPRDIYYTVQELAGRLKGPLGQKLLNLDYNTNDLTSGYLRLYPYTSNSHMQETETTVTSDYLQLSSNEHDSVYFHAGFFKDNYSPDNNYFLLANLKVMADRNTGIRITKSGFNNFRFRNIEPQYNFDTTFSSSIYCNMFFPAGEGYLFQVAPVLKYGGSLIYNDTVKTSSSVLNDNMTIKNGVTLSIKKNVTYIVMDTIALEGTGFISGQGYLNLGQGDINTVSWSKSLFKGVNGTHPRLYLRKPSTESAPTSYTVYRKIGSSEFTSLGNIPNTTTEFTDSTFDISPLYYPITEYYLKANFSGFSVNTNIVRYDISDIAIQNDSLILPGGWQTVSVPVIMTDSSAYGVFGTNYVYKYSGGYQLVSQLDNGVGYWANFASGPDTIVFNGTPIDTLAMPVDSGWNLKGSLFYNTFVSQVRAVPDTTINTIYKYQNGYVPLGPDSILKPGIGYWIKTRNSGTVYMEANFGKITSVPNIDFASMDKFTIKDAEGNQQILYVTNIDLDTISINADFEMPPYYSELPFDSRLEMNDLVKRVSAQAGPVDLNILVHTLSYPVTLTWQLNPANGITYTFIGDSILGKIAHNLNGSGSEEINSLPTGKIRLTALASGDYKPAIPDKFDLLQNYPNPFNPSTKIKYSVPEETHINLTVYNILGQEVVKLKNEVQKPGYYEITFDASSLSSGIYLYTLETAKFTSTKKMMVLK